MLRVDRRWTALEAADEGREIAMRKGAEEMQKQLEPQFKQLLESHEEMKAERQLDSDAILAHLDPETRAKILPNYGDL